MVKGLKITAPTGIVTFIPEASVRQLMTDTEGILSSISYVQATDGSMTTLPGIPIHQPGTNTKYEFGQLSPDGFVQAPLRNYR